MLLKTTFIVVGVSILWMFLQLRRENLNDMEKIAYLDVPDIIKYFGYSVEEHFVKTHDGYHLRVYRIPRAKNEIPYRGPVLIQHGFLQSSADWVMMGPDQSLGFLLAKDGYDVWMGNHRGNYYSSKHDILSTDEPEFWNFTLHDITMDIAPIIDYILEHTSNDQLKYVGFSMGATSPIVLLSEKPEYNSKMKIVISMAPASYPSRVLSFLTKHVFLGADLYKDVLDYLGVSSVLQRNHIYADIARMLCPDGRLLQSLCSMTMTLITGSNESNIDMNYIPVIFGHMPSGSSRYALAHVGQIIVSGGFHNYNYRYGSEFPKEYNIENFKTNVVLMCGTEDHIVPCSVVERVYSQISNIVDKNLYILKNTTHFDFVYGTHARKQIYDGIIQILDKYD